MSRPILPNEEQREWLAERQVNVSRRIQETRREKVVARRMSEGWSAQAAKAIGDESLPECWAEDQHPWGIQPPFSDKKSKRKRGDDRKLPPTYPYGTDSTPGPGTGI